MRVTLDGYSLKQIEVIKKHIEERNKGVTLCCADAVRWAISNQAAQIKSKKSKKGFEE